MLIHPKHRYGSCEQCQSYFFPTFKILLPRLCHLRILFNSLLAWGPPVTRAMQKPKCLISQLTHLGGCMGWEARANSSLLEGAGCEGMLLCFMSFHSITPLYLRSPSTFFYPVFHECPNFFIHEGVCTRSHNTLLQKDSSFKISLFSWNYKLSAAFSVIAWLNCLLEPWQGCHFQNAISDLINS